MKKTQVVRDTADALHGTEASLQAALQSARETLERMVAAKAELGLTGTVGDASIARMKDTVAALEQAWELMVESHQEAYDVFQAMKFQTRMDIVDIPNTFTRTGHADGARVA